MKPYVNFYLFYKRKVTKSFYLLVLQRAVAAGHHEDGQDGSYGCGAAVAAAPPPRLSHSPPAEHYVLFIFDPENIFLCLSWKEMFYVSYIQKYLTFRLHEQAGAVEGVEGPPLPASCTAATAPTAIPAL